MLNFVIIFYKYYKNKEFKIFTFYKIQKNV